LSVLGEVSGANFRFVRGRHAPTEGLPARTSFGSGFARRVNSVDASVKPEIRDRFRRLAAEWKERSRYISNTAQLAVLKPYQQIIGMGLPAVPLILAELQQEPDQWFWALEAITAENPVPPEAAGRVGLMAEAWIDWGRQRGFIVA
jgi:hypothetical protein